MVDLCWANGLTEGCKTVALEKTYHKPFATHDCIGPDGFTAAVHASLSQRNRLVQELVRAFYRGWYNELITIVPLIKDLYVQPMEGSGLGTELLLEVFERSNITTRRSEA